MTEKKDEKTELKTIQTEEHKYEVPIMNTIDGIGFAVRYPDMFASSLERAQLEELVMKKIAAPDTLFAFTLNLLSGMKIDDEACDDTGLCPMFRRNPVELYRALVVALCANFGDCFPFLEVLSGTGDSPSREQKNPQI